MRPLSARYSTPARFLAAAHARLRGKAAWLAALVGVVALALAPAARAIELAASAGSTQGARSHS